MILMNSSSAETLYDSPGTKQSSSDTPSQTLFGLRALLNEFADQGVSNAQLLADSGLRPHQLSDPQFLISRHQRLLIYQNAQRLTTRSDVALTAGARQRISDFCVFGFAMASCPTLGSALDLGFRYLPRIGHLLQFSSHVEGDLGILSSHNPWSLGDDLPFATELWRSSINRLLGQILEAPFPSVRMLFPYPAPSHWRAYEQTFGCPVEFDAGVDEWHYDARAQDQELPNANPMAVLIFQTFWKQLLIEDVDYQNLIPSITTILMSQHGNCKNIDSLAERLRISVRTLHRRLAAEGVTYQSIVDDVRRRLALRYLEQTSMTTDQIAERVGFSDAANFRKAFKRWTGLTPGEARRPQP